jgi:putative ABC transport system permease protein
MSAMMRGNLRMALSGVRGAKWRSILTMMGVIVGIVAVVTVVGIGEGVKRQVAQQLDHFGSDLIVVRPGNHAKDTSPITPGGTDAIFGMGATSGLSIHDVKAIEKTDGVAAVAPLGVVSGVVDAGGRRISDATVLATGNDLPSLLNQQVAFGDFWSSSDQNAYTAVIGSRVSAALFDENVALGHSFTFRGETFVVRGVLDEFKDVPFSPTARFDDAIFIPYQAAAHLTHADGQLYAVIARPADPNRMDDTIAAIRSELKDAHGGQEDFAVLGPKDSMQRGSEVVRLLTTWIAAVAAISLFIGGVGIMNIMLLTVTERMHEIGVRKAVGATNRQILVQFVLEATVLSVVGGIIGMLLSFAASGLLHVYTDLRPVISWYAVGVAFGVSVAIGIIFGAAPAIKAARKDPIEALRHE